MQLLPDHCWVVPLRTQAIRCGDGPFYLNLPAGAVAATLIALTIPASFPNDKDYNTVRKRHIKDWLSDLDILGAPLLSGTFSS